MEDVVKEEVSFLKVLKDKTYSLSIGTDIVSRGNLIIFILFSVTDNKDVILKLG
jgi:hypothetical protein